ncbi:MAG: ribosome silencing factor [Clostridia bacterium]|nr:ribosome silencing factor [Clostridia bacterium]
MESQDKAMEMAKALYAKKASDIEVLNISGITIVADFFVICTGNSSLQVQALANALMDKMEEMGEKPLRVEGMRDAGWVLLDFGNVVVHIFKQDIREFYGLERLWGDAERVEVTFME